LRPSWSGRSRCSGWTSRASRTCSCAESTVGVYDDWEAPSNVHSPDADDESGGLSSGRTHADGVSLASNTSIADVDIVIAGSKIPTGIKTHSDVVTAGCVVIKRTVTGGRVVVASCVDLERSTTGGRVVVAGRIDTERISANGIVA
jgi:hypothetical protein